ncbi:MAG: hypothetical protein KGO94_04690 [Alphaproteobacteria bacterium]|nr:hypothetical protein [Alphaproteobacteria bacterium]
MNSYPSHKFALIFFTTVIAIWLITMAMIVRAGALSDEATGTMLAVFEPSTSSDQVFANITKAGAKPIRQTSFGFIWVVSADEPGLAGRLRANGAIGSYRNLPLSPTIAGCFALADAKVAEAFQ